MFFDLPVTTKEERKAAAAFRKFLIKDGYHMIQFSVYGRVCNGADAVGKHLQRLRMTVPHNGSIRLLTITEKQYQSIEILVGSLRKEESPIAYQQLSIF